MVSLSETLVFLDGVPFPAPIESLTYDVNINTEMITYQQGSVHRPVGRDIELHIEICGYLPLLEFDTVHVIRLDSDTWIFSDTIIEHSEGQQIGDGYKTVWNINASSVEVKS